MAASTLRNTSFTRYHRTKNPRPGTRHIRCRVRETRAKQHLFQPVDVTLDVRFLRGRRVFRGLENDRQVLDGGMDRLAVLAEIHLQQIAARDLVGAYILFLELVDVHAILGDLDVLHQLVDAEIPHIQVHFDGRGVRGSRANRSSCRAPAPTALRSRVLSE